MLPAGAPQYFRKPWSAQDLARIDAGDRVLVLGTGLAAVNSVAALARQWHRGLVRIVSESAPLPDHFAALRGAGRVELWVGQVQGAAAYGDVLVVDVRPNGRRLVCSERFDWIIDGT